MASVASHRYTAHLLPTRRDGVRTYELLLFEIRPASPVKGSRRHPNLLAILCKVQIAKCKCDISWCLPAPTSFPSCLASCITFTSLVTFHQHRVLVRVGISQPHLPCCLQAAQGHKRHVCHHLTR